MDAFRSSRLVRLWSVLTCLCALNWVYTSSNIIDDVIGFSRHFGKSYSKKKTDEACIEPGSIRENSRNIRSGFSTEFHWLKYRGRSHNFCSMELFACSITRCRLSTYSITLGGNRNMVSARLQCDGLIFNATFFGIVEWVWWICIDRAGLSKVKPFYSSWEAFKKIELQRVWSGHRSNWPWEMMSEAMNLDQVCSFFLVGPKDRAFLQCKFL